MRKRPEWQSLGKWKAKNNNEYGNLCIRYWKNGQEQYVECVRKLEVLRHNKPWTIEA